MKNLLERTVAGEVSISDGAMGTFLHAKGLRAGECPESWRVSRPGAVKDIAAAYVAAGSDIVETNSFGGTAYKLKPYGFQPCRCIAGKGGDRRKGIRRGVGGTHRPHRRRRGRRREPPPKFPTPKQSATPASIPRRAR
jgi:hypothetical protein